MEYVYLTGSEDVLKAGHTMERAAAEMSRASNQIWEAMTRFENAVQRLEAIEATKEE